MNYQLISGTGKNSCTLTALCECMNISVERAKKIMASVKAEDYGVWTTNVISIYHKYMEPHPELANKRLSLVLPLLYKGRYIVRVRGHVFAVIDGTVRDTMKPTNKEVLMVYELLTHNS